MMNRALLGLVAGAAGTVALNIATYLDMAVRGRPASGVPAKMAGTVSHAAGIDLGGEQQAPNRREGLGALMGYLNGLGTGILVGLLSPALRSLPMPLASIVVGGAAMAGSDVPIAALRDSDPRTWGASGWLADIGPHLVYGFFAVGVFRWLERRSRMLRLHW
jgi:hypothetical protein